MGVRGLTTYVNYNQDVFLKKYLLHDCYIVVDGPNICMKLYECMYLSSLKSSLPLGVGGDYNNYGSYVRTFFRNLKRCNVTPYVIWDGSHEHKKYDTVFKRLQSIIQSASMRDPQDFVPVLLKDVFREALTDVNVQHTTCEFEADDEIAAMARHLNCPVLSYDSDFFIYGVLYIPFNTMNIEPIPIHDKVGKHAMVCKIYKMDHVTSYFEGLQKDSLPLLATLLGNDYIEPEVFEKFFERFIIYGGEGVSVQQRRIDGLLKWLQGESPYSAKYKILQTFNNEDQHRVSSMIDKSVEGYKSERCISLKYFKGNNEQHTTDAAGERVKDVEDSVNNTNSQSEVTSPCPDNIQSVPTWVSERIRDDRIPKQYITLYAHHMYFSSPQAEDFTDDDSFLCTLPILRYAYDILHDFPKKQCEYISREKHWDCKIVYVGKEYATPRPSKIPFQDLTDEKLRSYFHHFVQQKMKLMDMTDVKQLPSNFQVFMISILWWVSTCKVPEGHVHSLFICYVMLDFLIQRTVALRPKRELNNNVSNSLKPVEEVGKADIALKVNDGSVYKEEFELAARTLMKYFKVDEKILREQTTYDIRKVHVFAQFQNCLMQMNSLNTLCRCPFEKTKYSRTFNGTFVYNMAVLLENQTDPYVFIEHYLNGSTIILKCYENLCKIYQKCVDDMKSQNVKVNSGKAKNKKSSAKKKSTKSH